VSYVEYSPKNSTVLSAGIRQNTFLGTSGYVTACKKNIQEILASCVDKNPLIVFSLPAKQALIKKLSLDNNETNVRNLIELEIHQHIVGGIENYSIDYVPVSNGLNAGSASEYLVVAYNKNALIKLSAAVGSKNYSGSIIDIDVFALINAFSVLYHEYTELPAVIINAGQTETMVALSQRGNYSDSDIFSYDESILQSPKDYHLLLTQCLLNLGISENELSSSVALCFTGKLIVSAQIVDVFTSLCSTSLLFEPFRGLTCSTAVTNGVNIFETYELVTAMGLALRGGMEL
jgi:Tfp pilus assembly PilM family ATPase